MTKKPRKPQNLHVDLGLSYGWDVEVDVELNCIGLSIGDQFAYGDSHDAKKLHAWLGKAIAYLEAKEKKR